MLVEEIEIEFDILNDPLFISKSIEVLVARLDKIHPVISGNKIFKLHYFLHEAVAKQLPVLSFGGAWSNHLIATAYACKTAGLGSIGIVRGEKPEVLSQTLMQCCDYGMELYFISRKEYEQKNSDSFFVELKQKFGECVIIPEGGYHPWGAAGASLIMKKMAPIQATHICVATGTGTTIAGLLKNNGQNAIIIGIPVIKNMMDIYERISFLGSGANLEQLYIFDEYHFGGYAKKTVELLAFMNELFSKHNVPTDFIYTAKMMYAVTDKVKKGFFPAGSKILCLHTGGLQGNKSLRPGSLLF